MKTRLILLLSILALSMTIVSCNQRTNSRQNPRPQQNEQVGNKMNKGERNFKRQPDNQNERRKDFIIDRKNQERKNFPMKMLTEKQKEYFKTIRTSSMKEVLPLKDQLKELKLHEKTLMDADQPDINAINVNIDKMSALQNKIAKISAKMKIEMFSQLTSEQKMNMKSMKNSQGRHGQKGKVNNHNKNRSQCPSEK